MSANSCNVYVNVISYANINLKEAVMEAGVLGQGGCGAGGWVIRHVG